MIHLAIGALHAHAASLYAIHQAEEQRRTAERNAANWAEIAAMPRPKYGVRRCHSCGAGMRENDRCDYCGSWHGLIAGTSH